VEIKPESDRPAGEVLLGDVLYKGAPPGSPEAEWALLVQAVAAGEQPALHRLYERAHRVVYTLAVRITGDRATAEEVTLDVFVDIWRRAAFYHPSGGTVLGWIMNQARSRSIDRLRFDQRKKRLPSGAADPTDPMQAADPLELFVLKRDAHAVRAALATLSPAERQAVEAAFFSGLTHAEIATRFQEPLGTVKTRIRTGLQKLRRALGTEGFAT
jgi:RNA polymerase sigma-70 factor (ECF subfamily)